MSKDMTIYNMQILDAFDRGKRDALDLRERADAMDGTAIIEEERKIPIFEPDKDYSSWKAGSPIRELVDGEYQVYKWITPINTAYYPGFLPSKEPSICSLCHTKDPAKAKPYLAPNGTSGMYMMDEVCLKDDKLWKSIQDKNPYPPGEVGTEAYWEDVTDIEVDVVTA